MKKILLIITLVFLIFQLVALAVDIDIGMPAIHRSTSLGTGFTLVEISNPASTGGTITSVEIYVASPSSNVKVAIFYVVSGNNLSTRVFEVIGDVASGYNQFDVNLNVLAEDFIGIYNADLELDFEGYGVWYAIGDEIPCTDTTFTDFGEGPMSLYGTGATVEVGWNGPFNAVAVTKWNNIEITKWNTIE